MIEIGLKKAKTQKTVVKQSTVIYSEPGILILFGVPFDFGFINSFRTVLDQRTTISSLNRGRNLELKNEAVQIPASFSMLKLSV